MDTPNTPRHRDPGRAVLALLGSAMLITFGTSVRQIFDLTLTLGF